MRVENIDVSVWRLRCVCTKAYVKSAYMATYFRFLRRNCSKNLSLWKYTLKCIGIVKTHVNNHMMLLQLSGVPYGSISVGKYKA